MPRLNVQRRGSLEAVKGHQVPGVGHDVQDAVVHEQTGETCLDTVDAPRSVRGRHIARARRVDALQAAEFRRVDIIGAAAM